MKQAHLERLRTCVSFQPQPQPQAFCNGVFSHMLVPCPLLTYIMFSPVVTVLSGVSGEELWEEDKTLQEQEKTEEKEGQESASAEANEARRTARRMKREWATGLRHIDPEFQVHTSTSSEHRLMPALLSALCSEWQHDNGVATGSSLRKMTTATVVTDWPWLAPLRRRSCARYCTTSSRTTHICMIR